VRGVHGARGEIGESNHSTKEAIPMKTNLSDEIDLIAIPNNSASRTSQLEPIGRQTLERSREWQTVPLGDFVAIVALLTAFFSLLFLGLRTTPAPAVAQTFELPVRPIWISNVPYAPRDGLVPDFEQSDMGRSQQTTR
jgi:hypothetical protein